MDWIEEKLKDFKESLMLQSLRTTLVIYSVISILIVMALYMLTIKFCNGWQALVNAKYNYDINSMMPLEEMVKLEGLDKFIVTLVMVIERYCIVAYSIIAIILTTNIFYKNRIEEPLNILQKEAKYVAHNDLSFSCSYNSKDEMGKICEGFEEMRLQLLENNENMWKLMESQRTLNSAFAHDIRTPLTVMQGYLDFLQKYLPQGKISEEKLTNTISLMQSQVNKLNDFTNRMKDIQDIEAIEVRPKLNNFDILEKALWESVEGIREKSPIKINITNKILDKEGYFDKGIILQVVDNLLSNSLSYAEANIDVILQIDNQHLSIYIRDDGKGFSREELYYASRPYYSSRKGEEAHMGIGLTICRMLCEKHGGKLTLNNSTYGGAIVCANFFAM